MKNISFNNSIGDKYYRYLNRLAISVIALCLLLGGATTAKSQEGFANNRYLIQKELDKREAVIWYLGHSGWAVKTKTHLLIFDYVEGKQYLDFSLYPEHKVIDFVSHSHNDHYNSWKEQSKNIKYVFGWMAENGPNHVFMEGNMDVNVGDVSITSIPSTDEGVAFMVEVDDLVILHAGDHAYWGGSFNSYTREIDYLADRYSNIDFIFIPVYCGRGNYSTITKGAYYAITRLNPKIMFPMHCDGKYYYKEFAETVKKKNFKTKTYYAENSGDIFFYSSGEIEKK